MKQPPKQISSPENIIKPEPKKPGLLRRVGRAALAGAVLNLGIGMVAPTDTMTDRQEQAFAESHAARQEKQFQDKFLEANEAEERAVVRTNSGITFRFYSPGVYDQPKIDVDPTEVNNLTSFALANLSNLKQTYLSSAEIAALQAKAARAELDKVNVAVMFCYNNYNQVNTSFALSSPHSLS